MVLAAGDRLGRYDITAPLGRGGMGEVYRAIDTTLEREVAVKVLPEGVADDPDRLARFEREAKAVARLAHPNILEIWDFGSDQGVAYAVTELLEGGTLREEISAGPLSWRRAQDIGAAVADGLAAAHGKGIVHRDLKPENIFITVDGRVKVLDFGLARMEGPVSTEAETGTLTPADTQRGTILGTLGYISPEQLRGEPADARSDIFSLGCVLYEMLSGQGAFVRDSAVDTMAAILKEDPPPFTSTGVPVGTELARTVARCLEKRPERRFQSAADLAFALRAIVTDSDVPGTAPQVMPAAGPTAGRWWLWAAAAILVAVAVGLVGWRLFSPAKPTPAEPPEIPAGPSPFVSAWVITVEPFENRTGDSSFDVAGKELADVVAESVNRVTQGFPSLPTVTVLAGRPGGASDASTAEPPPEGQGRLLVTGSYTAASSDLEAVVQIRDRDGLRVLYTSGRFAVGRTVSEHRLEPLLSRVMGAVGMQLVFGLQNVSHVPDYPVFREFISCRDMLYTRGPRQRCEQIHNTLEEDPEFLQFALLGAFSATVARRSDEAVELLAYVRQRSSRLTPFESAYLELLAAWSQGELFRALTAARTLQEINPGYFPAAAYRTVLAMQLNRPAELVEASEEVVRTVPPIFLATRRGGEAALFEAYRALGQYDELLALAQRVRRERPGDTAAFVQEARALAALGRLEELDALVEECRSTPGGECRAAEVEVEAAWFLEAYDHHQQALEYANRAVVDFRKMDEQDQRFQPVYYLYALRAAERWDEYAEFAARSVNELPDDPQQPYFRCCLGIAAAHRGDRETAETIERQLVADGLHMYAAAVIAHLGDRDRAVELLRRSLTESTSTFRQIVQWDLDLEPLWDYPPFQELIRPKG
jgi:tetratricopeptide (TPR) repeat protein